MLRRNEIMQNIEKNKKVQNEIMCDIKVKSNFQSPNFLLFSNFWF